MLLAMDRQALTAERKKALGVTAEVRNGVCLVKGAYGRRTAKGNVLHND